MSNGTYCIIRDLGLVKGGKGLRHHECLLRIPRLLSRLLDAFRAESNVAPKPQLTRPAREDPAAFPDRASTAVQFPDDLVADAYRSSR